MKIAIVGGTGEEGTGLGLRWGRAGVEVIIGSRQQEKGQGVAAKLNQMLGTSLFTGTENRRAAALADLVVLTVPYAAHAATLQAIKDQVTGKILIDVSVPLDPSNPRRLVVPGAGSAAEEAQQILGTETRVVAALQNLSAYLLRDPQAQLEGDVLVCGNDRQARQEVIRLVRFLGVRGIDAGPLECARLIEPITALLIGLNIRYKVPAAGIHITGLPDLSG